MSCSFSLMHIRTCFSNTYTNKTWSEVSGIELNEINKMEREFLAGIDFGLYVDKQRCDSWLNLLKGLVMAKERDSRYWRRSRQGLGRAYGSKHDLALPTSTRSKPVSSRARSSSPSRRPRWPQQPAVDYDYSAYPSMDSDSPTRHGKRTAVDAFSPTSATFDDVRPHKKSMGLSLQIPETVVGGAVHTPSPLESLQFSKLSLASSPAGHENGMPSDHHRHVSPHTLVAAYRMDPTKPKPTPQVRLTSPLCLSNELTISFRTSTSIHLRVLLWLSLGKLACGTTSLVPPRPRRTTRFPLCSQHTFTPQPQVRMMSV